MSFKTSKTSDPHRLLLNLSAKIDLKRSDKYVALSNISIYYTWKDMKKSCKTINLKSGPTWNEKCELCDRSYPVLDIQDRFKYIIKSMKQWLIILQ